MKAGWKTRLKEQRPAIVLLMLGVAFALVGLLVRSGVIPIAHAGSDALEALVTRMWIAAGLVGAGLVFAGLANVVFLVAAIRKKFP